MRSDSSKNSPQDPGSLGETGSERTQQMFRTNLSEIKISDMYTCLYTNTWLDVMNNRKMPGEYKSLLKLPPGMKSMDGSCPQL